MILSAIAERLKRRSKDDFKGRHFEAPLILQGVCWYLRYCQQPHSPGAQVASQTPIGSSGSKGRCRGSAAFSPSTRRGGPSGGWRPCCGCARALISLTPGRCASRTSFCRSSPAARLIGTPRKRTISAREVSHG